LTQTLVDSCVDFEVAHLSVLMFQRLLYLSRERIQRLGVKEQHRYLNEISSYREFGKNACTIDYSWDSNLVNVIPVLTVWC